jgi:hypothetical protein
MVALAFARWLSLTALGVACGCAAPSTEDTVSPAGEARDEPTGEARSALGAFLWTRAASSEYTHTNITAVPLEDGRIFVIDTDEQNFPCEIYDPAADRWTPVAPLPRNYMFPRAAPLPGNRVLAVGHVTAAAYVYDVERDAWSQVGDMSAARSYPTEAVPLADGRVLLAGREQYADVTSVDVFDPDTLEFQPVGALSTPRHLFSATRLLDGRVLFAGGADIDEEENDNKVDIFDPKSGTIEPVSPLPKGRRRHNAVLLPVSGEVLLFGGILLGSGDAEATKTAVLYDPIRDRWTPVADMHKPDKGRAAAYMPLLGRVITTGGGDGHVETFDPVSKQWEVAAPMLLPRKEHRLVPLPQGWLFAVGGRADSYFAPGLRSNEVFGPLGTPCMTASDCGRYAHCVDSVCCATTCGGVCKTCKGTASLGRCTSQVPGEDARSDCDGMGCNAACDGNGQCAFTPVGEPCTPPRCSEDSTHLLAPPVCGEDLACVDPSPNPVDCAPYQCGPVEGRPACKTRCDSLSDCVPGHVCDLQGRCVAPPPLAPPASCSAAPASGETGALELWAAGLFLLLAIGRRRTRGRREATAGLFCALGLSACAAPDIAKEADGQSSPRPAGAPTVPAEPAWYPVMPPEVPRDFVELVTLRDGSVLALGGGDAPLENIYRMVDRFDPVTRRWESMQDLPYSAFEMLAVLLNDGRVLVTGGWGYSGPTRSAAVGDPETGEWVQIPMEHARWSHAMVRLQDGRVLVAGGFDKAVMPQATVEIFDPAGNTWSPAPMMDRAIGYASATLGADGDVFVSGGTHINAPDGPTADEKSVLVERFDPRSQSWSQLPPMQEKRWDPDIVTLLDGRLLVLGNMPPYTTEVHGEVFEPRTSTWAPVRGENAFPSERFTTQLLPDGRVLIAGGDSIKTWLFDPATMRMRPAASTIETHNSGRAALIPGHGVLMFGMIPELYTALGAPCAAEADCLGAVCAGGTCCSPGCECGTCSPFGCSLLGAPEKKGISVCEPSCVGATRERRPVPCDIYSPECLYEETDCVAYRCDPAAGGCRTDCDGPADCAEGFACTVERRCVAPPAPVSTASCSAAPRASGGAAGALLAAVALAAACALRRAEARRRGARVRLEGTRAPA